MRCGCAAAARAAQAATAATKATKAARAAKAAAAGVTPAVSDAEIRDGTVEQLKKVLNSMPKLKNEFHARGLGFSRPGHDVDKDTVLLIERLKKEIGSK